MKTKQICCAIVLAAAMTITTVVRAAETQVVRTSDAALLHQPLVNAINKVNQGLPKKLDETTTLTSVHLEGEKNIVYLYTVNVPAAQINFSVVSKAVLSDGIAHWCNGAETLLYRQIKADITYRYEDTSGKHIGDVTVKTEECH